MHALLLGVSRVYIEWTVSVCSKRVTPITLPPFNHGSAENVTVAKEKQIVLEAYEMHMKKKQRKRNHYHRNQSKQSSQLKHLGSLQVTNVTIAVSVSGFVWTILPPC